MSGWGCIWDGVGKLKPEAWLVKKAYSPVRIDQRTFAIPEDGGTAEIRVANRFNHTSLSELKVEWIAGSDAGGISLPAVPPGESGSLSVPARRWQQGEELVLRFYAPDGVMVDAHRLAAGADQADGSVDQRADACGHRGNRRGDCDSRGRAPDRRQADGKDHLLWRDQTLIRGGPHLHLTGMNPGPWKPDEGGVRIERRAHESSITIAGAYGAFTTAFRVSLSGNGVLTAAYELRSGTVDQRELSEVGLSFDLPDSADRIQWRREGLWTAYPQDHIGRSRGTASRVRDGAAGQPDSIGRPQPWPWKDNMRDFSLYKRLDPQARTCDP